MQDRFEFEELPFSMEAEQSVLGVLILSPLQIPKVLSILDEDCFYKGLHKKLFSVLVGLKSL